MTELKPCPFCGSAAERETAAGWHGIYCENSQCPLNEPRLPRESEWNARANPPPTDRVIDVKPYGGARSSDQTTVASTTGQPDELAEDFDQEQSRKALTDDARELLKQPLVQSLLYDLNLLPEQITKYKHWYYMLAVIAHMGEAMKTPKREISRGGNDGNS